MSQARNRRPVDVMHEDEVSFRSLISRIGEDTDRVVDERDTPEPERTMDIPHGWRDIARLCGRAMRRARDLAEQADAQMADEFDRRMSGDRWQA